MKRAEPSRTKGKCIMDLGELENELSEEGLEGVSGGSISQLRR